MVTIFLDIEVLAQDPEPFMIPRVEDLDPPATYKKPESIAEWRAEKAATLVGDLRDKSSLEPLLGGTVVVVAIASGARPPSVLFAPTPDEEGELDLLTRLEAMLLRVDKPQFVTWNGHGYDYPYLGKRALRHGLYALARMMYRDKPWVTTHLDLFQTWQQGSRTAMGKLSAVAEFFGIPADDFEITGKDVAAAIADGHLDRVQKHCAGDLERLRAVYWRLRAASWVAGDAPIPDDLTARPPRPTERMRILQACAELQIEIDKGSVKAAANAAGMAWEGKPPIGDGPVIDSTTPIEHLREFLAGLQARRP